MEDCSYNVMIATKQIELLKKDLATIEDKSMPMSSQTAHLFKATASNATSTLDIKVVDRFGNTYTESMERPKQFNYSMR